MEKIPKSHPRYASLMTREKVSQASKKGLVHETGLISHGRGEAFDYLIDEKTNDFANEAEKVAGAALICAKNPVISLNGNVVALVANECLSLAELVSAKLEVNLFHRTEERIEKLVNEMKNIGAKVVYGKRAEARIPGLSHDRSLCDKEGIFSADVVLVPLEDGDRCQALRKMGKYVIAIDLNPLSRTSKNANITIVDNVVRAIPNIERWVGILKNEDEESLERVVSLWDNKKMLADVLSFISKRLNSLF
jgi:4-phosphopantoate--beta-alanine ligase